jgi:hypothetical protein
MYLEFKSGRSISKIEATSEVLKLFPLKKKWKQIQGLKEDILVWSSTVYGWGRIINDKHVLVLLNRCGEYHTKWRMYVDGEMVYCMDNIVVVMGSGKSAMLEAEAYMNSSSLRLEVKFKSDKMKFTKLFDDKMVDVLQKTKIGV